MTITRCPACHRRIKRSSAANGLYWALVHEIAERIRPAGNTYSADQWHEYMKSRFLGADDMKLPNGKVLTIPKSSADLDVDQFSEYLAKVEAFAAERGVYLETRD